MTQDTDKHDQARELTEQALEKIDQGQERAADRLLDKAKQLDETAVAEVVEDLDEDATDRGDAS